MSRKFLYLGALGTTEDSAYTSDELSSTDNGEGASLIGVEDALGLFLASDQEGVNNELAQAILNLTEKDTFETYGEATCPVSVETKITDYTVPVGQTFFLKSILMGGDNISKFLIKKNGTVFANVRTWWTQFDKQINFDNLKFESNDILSVHAVNLGDSTEIFDCTILGELD